MNSLMCVGLLLSHLASLRAGVGAPLISTSQRKNPGSEKKGELCGLPARERGAEPGSPQPRRGRLPPLLPPLRADQGRPGSQRLLRKRQGVCIESVLPGNWQRGHKTPRGLRSHLTDSYRAAGPGRGDPRPPLGSVQNSRAKGSVPGCGRAGAEAPRDRCGRGQGTPSLIPRWMEGSLPSTEKRGLTRSLLPAKRRGQRGRGGCVGAAEADAESRRARQSEPHAGCLGREGAPCYGRHPSRERQAGTWPGGCSTAPCPGWQPARLGLRDVPAAVGPEQGSGHGEGRLGSEQGWADTPMPLAPSSVAKAPRWPVECFCVDEAVRGEERRMGVSAGRTGEGGAVLRPTPCLKGQPTWSGQAPSPLPGPERLAQILSGATDWCTGLGGAFLAGVGRTEVMGVW